MPFVDKSIWIGTTTGVRLGLLGNRLARWSLSFGMSALAAAMVLGALERDAGRRLFYAYLVAFAWVLTLGVGAVLFVTLQHLVNAKWSIGIRRIGEVLAASVGCVGLLAVPVVGLYVTGYTERFSPGDRGSQSISEMSRHQEVYLGHVFFCLRWIAYFAFWSLWSWFLLRQSRAQDEGKCVDFIRRLRQRSAPAMIGLVVTVTFAAIDLLTVVEPLWASSVFGLYFISGSAISALCGCIISIQWVHSKGLLLDVVTEEHFHDLGKMLFSFTMVWAYFGFCQFLIIWYANAPEETVFYFKRSRGEWSYVSVSLVFVHFVLPFCGLLSRRAKRSRWGLLFWSVWLLIAHYVDLYWLIRPNYDAYHVSFGLIELLCWCGQCALFVATAVRRASEGALIPIRDPRLRETAARVSC